VNFLGAAGQCQQRPVKGEAVTLTLLPAGQNPVGQQRGRQQWGVGQRLGRQKLIGQATAPQFLQAGKLLEEGLALMFQVGVIREVLFHIVVLLLQYSSKK